MTRKQARLAALEIAQVVLMKERYSPSEVSANILEKYGGSFDNDQDTEYLKEAMRIVSDMLFTKKMRARGRD